ncbi:Uncharacterized protein OBRU01_10054 [Operophtera brumata]|uniref:Uncharacterized protein n=1 Tax=Operophtera brumata TaxID=104452 RepID=A0A0L7LF51_OPEBR|nr:Uncharacterized protein OBRU01_10054 [Operophtera brumata]
MKEKIPTTTVLIWDDMLRSTKPNKWHFTSNNTNLEPVYWDYSPKLGISHLNLLNYRRNFRNIWIASAFKGADGKTATIPKIRDRFQNHFSWLKLILNYKFGGESKVYNFKGIILTGWSRYTHMDPPCELLPVAIPSLVLDLILVKKFIAGLELDATSIANADIDDFFNVHVSNEYGKGLKCNTDFVIDLENILNCYFESRELYSLLHRYEQLKAGISLVFNTDDIPLFSCEYYASKKFIEKTHLIENINWCENAMKELITIEVALRENMKMYYKKRVIDEYLIYKTYSLKKNLEVILKALNSYKNTFVWNRNPLLGNVSD